MHKAALIILMIRPAAVTVDLDFRRNPQLADVSPSPRVGFDQQRTRRIALTKQRALLNDLVLELVRQVIQDAARRVIHISKA